MNQLPRAFPQIPEEQLQDFGLYVRTGRFIGDCLDCTFDRICDKHYAALQTRINQ